MSKCPDFFRVSVVVVASAAVDIVVVVEKSSVTCPVFTPPRDQLHLFDIGTKKLDCLFEH